MVVGDAAATISKVKQTREEIAGFLKNLRARGNLLSRKGRRPDFLGPKNVSFDRYGYEDVSSYFEIPDDDVEDDDEESPEPVEEEVVSEEEELPAEEEEESEEEEFVPAPVSPEMQIEEMSPEGIDLPDEPISPVEAPVFSPGEYPVKESAKKAKPKSARKKTPKVKKAKEKPKRVSKAKKVRGGRLKKPATKASKPKKAAPVAAKAAKKRVRVVEASPPLPPEPEYNVPLPSPIAPLYDDARLAPVDKYEYNFPGDEGDAEEGGRRSRRSRIRPLQWWKSERTLYVGDKLTAIVRGVATPAVNLARRSVHPAKKRKTSGPKEAAPSPMVLSEEITAPVVEGKCQVYDVMVGEQKEAVVVRADEALDYIAPQNDDEEDNAYIIGEAFKGDEEEWTCGVIQMFPGMSKATRANKNHDEVFFVGEGAVEFIIQDTKFQVTKGGHVFVPCQNKYALRNMSTNKPAMLVYNRHMVGEDR